MACVSITKAAKLAGVSRNTLYKTYINTGALTVSKNDSGRKCIDTSELLRVFGGLQSDSSEDDSKLQGVTVDRNPQAPPDSAHDYGVKLLRYQLEEALKRGRESEEREQWYKQKIDTLTDSLKLLDSPARSRARWWQFWK